MTKGYIATTTVLLVMAVIMAITVTVTLLSIGSAQGSLALNGGEAAWNMTEGCLEDALELTRTSLSYSGGVINHPDGSCTISVTKGGGNWTVTATPTTGIYRRTIQAILINTGAGITISSWKEQ